MVGLIDDEQQRLRQQNPQQQNPQQQNPQQQERPSYNTTLDDFYQRRQKETERQKQTNLQQAQAQAAQQSVLAGWNPEMASRAQLEAQAGAYEANKQLDSGFNDFAMGVEQEKYNRAMANPDTEQANVDRLMKEFDLRNPGATEAERAEARMAAERQASSIAMREMGLAPQVFADSKDGYRNIRSAAKSGDLRKGDKVEISGKIYEFDSFELKKAINDNHGNNFIYFNSKYYDVNGSNGDIITLIDENGKKVYKIW